MRTRYRSFGLGTALVLVGAMVALGAPSAARTGGQDAVRPRSTTAWKSFTSSKDGGTRFTLTTEGNVLLFHSPNGSEHLNVGSWYEGYVLCHSGLTSYDLGSTSSGFAPASQTDTTVSRSVSNGTLVLKQTFTFSVNGRSLQIAMNVKNTTQQTISGVSIRRVADLDVDGDWADDWHTKTADAYMAWDTHGAVLKHVSQPSGVTHSTKIFAGAGGGLMACAPSTAAGPVSGDQGGSIDYVLGNLTAGQSRTVKVTYERI